MPKVIPRIGPRVLLWPIHALTYAQVRGRDLAETGLGWPLVSLPPATIAVYLESLHGGQQVSGNPHKVL